MQNILHVINRLDYERGSTTWLAYMLIGTDSPDIRHFIISTSSELGSREKEFSNAGISIVHIRLNYLYPFKYLYTLNKIITQNKISIVQTHLGWLGAYDTFVALLSGVKSRIIYFHSGDWLHAGKPWHRLGAWFFTLLGKMTATHYSAGSEIALKRWLSKHQLASGRCKVITAGISFIDFTRFNMALQRRSMGIPDDALLIGHAGRLTPEKNHITILKSFIILRKHFANMHLALIGDGPERQKLQAFCAIHNMEEYVHFLGIRHDVRECMKAMDVFFFPSLFESYGLVALEAQDAGTRLLASNIPVLDKLISPVWQDYRFNPKNTEEMIVQCINILKLPKTRPDEFLTKHSLQGSLAELTNFYKSFRSITYAAN